MSRVFANGLGDQGSILGQVISKTQKMVLDATLLNTQYYKVRMKWNNPGNGVVPSPLHLNVVDIEKEAIGSPLAKVANFTYLHNDTWNHLTVCNQMIDSQ